MSRFNCEGLFFLTLDDAKRRTGRRGVHIARTDIAGCTTECGIVLTTDMQYSTREPRGVLYCRTCEDAVINLNHMRGMRA